LKRLEFAKKYFIIICLIIITLWGITVNFVKIKVEESKYKYIKQEISSLEIELNSIINNRLLVFEMISNEVNEFISKNDTIDAEFFDKYGVSNKITEKGFIDYEIAPNGIISYVYPLEGNEMILNEDLINDVKDKKKSNVLRSIANHEVVISGPTSLLRGGIGLVIRKPLYMDDEFWGFVNAVVDLEDLSIILSKYNESNIYHYLLINDDNDVLFDDKLKNSQLTYAKKLNNKYINLSIMGIISPKTGLVNDSILRIFEYASLAILVLILASLYWILTLNTRLNTRLNKIIYYDILTNLPNRRLLNEKIKGLIKSKHSFYLAFIDLDDFKHINDTLGHTFGDKVLVAVTKRFLQPKHHNITAYRWGGDEFILIFKNMDKDEVTKYINEIIGIFSAPLVIDTSEFFLSLSMGIVNYPEDANTHDDLIKKADTLMYTIKDTSKNNFTFYSKEIETQSIANIHLSNRMKTPGFANELVVYYQPKLDIATNSIIGMEALARWQIDDKILTPFHFISIAEANRKIDIIDKQIIKTAFHDTKIINSTREKPIKVSVNISVMNLNKAFFDFIYEQIDIIKINPKNIEIEITESLSICDTTQISEILSKMIELGITVALDDFGKGFASLNYLLKLPISTIKIDKDFIDNIDKSIGSDIINSIMSLAKVLKKNVVAEGVETSEQLQYLSEIECDEYQGYLFSKPVDLEQFKKLL